MADFNNWNWRCSTSTKGSRVYLSLFYTSYYKISVLSLSYLSCASQSQCPSSTLITWILTHLCYLVHVETSMLSYQNTHHTSLSTVRNLPGDLGTQQSLQASVHGRLLWKCFDSWCRLDECSKYCSIYRFLPFECDNVMLGVPWACSLVLGPSRNFVRLMRDRCKANCSFLPSALTFASATARSGRDGPAQRVLVIFVRFTYFVDERPFPRLARWELSSNQSPGWWWLLFLTWWWR